MTTHGRIIETLSPRESARPGEGSSIPESGFQIPALLRAVRHLEFGIWNRESSLVSFMVLALAVVLMAAPLTHAPAQEPGGDDALKRLLKKVEEPAPPPEAAQGKSGKDQADQPKPGDVAPEDRDLDSLLKKLGETTDEPETQGKAAEPSLPGGQPGEPKPSPAERGPKLEGQEKALDEHLEELTGRKKKKDRDEPPQKADENSPLKEAIKKMEEVRKRLSESDTGETTRQRQEEIVKELDQILQRLRQQRGQQQRMAMRTRQQGQANQPGQGESESPNNTGAGVGASKPKSPTVGQMLAGRKDTWGDLPPALREELENVFKTDMLPSKSELIRRYYSAVAKKGRAREEAAR
jgi:hypothetical protein